MSVPTGGVPFTSEIFIDVRQGGQATLQARFQTFMDSDLEQAVSGVTITITPAAGGATVIGPTSTGVVAIDTATYYYLWNVPATQAAGDYTATWNGTGPGGTLTINQTVTVAAQPSGAPGIGVYATVGQYQEWSGDTLTPPAMVQTFLRRSSEVIDLAMIGAVYETDQDELPTDAGVIDAMMRATCAQCQFEIANNDPALVKQQFVTSSVGGVAVTRNKAATGQSTPPLAPRAAAILRTAGVLEVAPLISW